MPALLATAADALSGRAACGRAAIGGRVPVTTLPLRPWQIRSPQRGAKRKTVIPTAKEELEVGKQQAADTAAYRIRRYVIERPVEAQVPLHEERVTVERRQPTQAVPGEHAFEEKVVEATETREEPVVSKVVKPGEEVVVRKEAQDRTETVRETVRESKVEVDKAAAGDKPPADKGPRGKRGSRRP